MKRTSYYLTTNVLIVTHVSSKRPEKTNNSGMILRLIFIAFSIATLSSCITEYQPGAITGQSEMLIIDGTITDGITIIRLSRSYGLNENFAGNIPVTDAEVVVETKGGIRTMPGLQPERGRYEISTGLLNPDSLYRLHIRWGDDTYSSEFLQPLITPAIDSIYYWKEGPGKPLQIFVNSTNTATASPFYRWSFEEIWEFNAELYAMGAMDPTADTLMIYDEREGPFNLKFNCWQRSKSNTLILESTLQLTENVINDKKIHEILPGHKRISQLYYIDVTQYSIRKTAYDYFSNLQKNIDEMGSIFAPIPSELNGNVRCMNRDVPAIGYVDVCIPSKRNLFISREQAQYEAPGKSCEVSENSRPGFGIYSIDNTGIIRGYAPFGCIDCTYNGGTKDKPAFWPNNHL